MADHEAMKDKIRKLLSLSKSPNEHEARRALAKAQELMLRYNISVCEPAKEDVYFKRIRFWQGERLSLEVRTICGICDQYCCEAITDIYEDKLWVSVFGSESDVDVCVQAIEFAYKTFCSCWRAYWKRVKCLKYYGPSKRRASRIDYCLGFVIGITLATKASSQEHGLVAVVHDAVRSAVKEHKDKLLESLGIVVADSNLPDKSAKKKRKFKGEGRDVDICAYLSGVASGKHVIQKDQLTCDGF